MAQSLPTFILLLLLPSLASTWSEDTSELQHLRDPFSDFESDGKSYTSLPAKILSSAEPQHPIKKSNLTDQVRKQAKVKRHHVYDGGHNGRNGYRVKGKRRLNAARGKGGVWLHNKGVQGSGKDYGWANYDNGGHGRGGQGHYSGGCSCRYNPDGGHSGGGVSNHGYYAGAGNRHKGHAGGNGHSGSAGYGGSQTSKSYGWAGGKHGYKSREHDQYGGSKGEYSPKGVKEDTPSLDGHEQSGGYEVQHADHIEQGPEGHSEGCTGCHGDRSGKQRHGGWVEQGWIYGR